MRLMKLAPEAVRLRRIARAYAAGELGETEYRRARRDVIDHFATGAPADDDTRPRFPEDNTLRNETLKRERASGAEGSSDDGAPGAELAEAAAVPLEARPPARPWLWLLVLGVVLAAGCLSLTRG